MKGTLTFNLPEEQEEFEAASKGSYYKDKIGDIWQVFFRPRYKHGYEIHEINEMLGLSVDEEEMTPEQRECNRLMDHLELLYKQHFSEE